MRQLFEKFRDDESGAITVDWVGLTAAILGVMFGALIAFNQGAASHAQLTAVSLDATGTPSY